MHPFGTCSECVSLSTREDVSDDARDVDTTKAECTHKSELLRATELEQICAAFSSQAAHEKSR